MPIVLLTEQERLGTTVAGRYKLDAILGSGGMAVVLKATHTWTGRDVAVKFLDPRKTRDFDTASKRFLKEGRVIGALAHPNVVKVLDMGRDEHGIVFQVLELLHGHTLADRLDRDGRLNVKETLDALIPIMDALTAAHEMEIIHRDLKPENIFISTDESGAVVPKLLDFGVAKGFDDEADGSLTREGSILGTPYYMAPEQARGASSVGPPADIFSIGAVAFECLVGELPFGDMEPTAYAFELISGSPPKVLERRSSIDEGIAEVIDRALSIDVEERYASMLEMRQALASAARRANIEVPEPAVFTPEARTALLSMTDDDVAETLGDDTLLSDLLEGASSGPPHTQASMAFKVGVAIAGVLAILLGFTLAGGGQPDSSDEVESGGAPAPVAGEPIAMPMPEEDDPVAGAREREAGVAGAATSSLEAGDGAIEGEASPVVRRLAVKRGATPARGPRSEVGTGMEAASGRDAPGGVGSPAVDSGPADPARIQGVSMRRVGPRVVREF